MNEKYKLGVTTQENVQDACNTIVLICMLSPRVHAQEWEFMMTLYILEEK